MPAGGQDDPTILIWDILAKSPICVCKKTFDRPFVATKLKFTPHFDHVFMVGGQDKVCVWNLDERTKKATNFNVPLGMDYFNNWTWNSINLAVHSTLSRIYEFTKTLIYINSEFKKLWNYILGSSKAILFCSFENKKKNIKLNLYQ